MQRFRGGLEFKAHRLCVSLNSRLESNKEEEESLSRQWCGEVLEDGGRDEDSEDSVHVGAIGLALEPLAW